MRNALSEPKVRRVLTQRASAACWGTVQLSKRIRHDNRNNLSFRGAYG